MRAQEKQISFMLKNIKIIAAFKRSEQSFVLEVKNLELNRDIPGYSFSRPFSDGMNT